MFDVFEAVSVNVFPLTGEADNQFSGGVVSMRDTKNEVFNALLLPVIVTAWLAVAPGPEMVRATGPGLNVRP